jgi:hypothetical protein
MPIPLAYAAGMGALSGLGGMGSAMSGASQMNSNIDQSNRTIQGIAGQIPGQSEQLRGELSAQYSPYTQNAGSDMDAYRGAMNAPTQQYNQYDPFAYDLNTQSQQFLDPSMDFQIQQATDAVEGSAANAGQLFSSATGKGIADRSQEIAKQAWKDSMQMAMQDRGFSYDVFSDDINRDRANTDLAVNQQGMKMDALGNMVNIGANATTNLANQNSNIRQGEFTGINEAGMAIANNNMNRQDDSFMGNMGAAMQGAGNMFGSLYGGG